MIRFVDLGDRLRQLLLARLMRGELELALHLGPRQLQRLDLAGALGIESLARLPRLPLFFFAFFHPLGEAGFRVDEPFSGITHV